MPSLQLAKAPLLLAGRGLFGVSMAAFGVLCLVYVDYINSLQPVPAGMPAFGAVAIAVGLLLLVAGLAIPARFYARPACLALVAMFALGIVLLLIPSAFTNPELLRSPWWIRTFESVALAGAALTLAGISGEPLRRSWVVAGHIAFGVSLPVFGVLHFVYPESIAALVALSPVAYPWPMFWAWLTGAGHVAAGLAIASGVCARLAAVLAGGMYAVWALTLHLPRIIDPPPGYSGNRQELTSLFVCVAFVGSAWIIAATREYREAPPDRPAGQRGAHRSPKDSSRVLRKGFNSTSISDRRPVRMST